MLRVRLASLLVALLACAHARGGAPETDAGGRKNGDDFPDALPLRDDLLGGSLGVGHMQTHDGLVRSLRWAGPAPELRFFYRHEGPQHVHLANFRFPLGFLSNRYGHSGAAWDAQLDYGYAHPVTFVAKDVELALGGRVRWDWAVQYYADFDEEHLYWMNGYELGPLVVARWRLDPKNSFVGEFDTPLVALVSRPPERRFYKIDALTHPGFFFSKTHEDVRLTAVHEHTAVRLRAAYRRRLGSRGTLEVRYALDFAYDSEPAPFMLLSNTISLGLAYAF